MTKPDWDPDSYAANARFVSDLGGAVLALLDPQPGERILDIGCGDGALTERIAAAGAKITGIDASEAMIEAARARGLDAHVMDAQGAGGVGTGCDAVFSNAAMHWMTDADAVIANTAAALRPGGRFVAEFGGFGNVAAIATALRAVTKARGHEVDLGDIWYFPTDIGHRARLETAGFMVEEIALIPRPTPVPSGMRAWLETLAAPVLARMEVGARAGILDEVTALLAPQLLSAEGMWHADYVRLRFRALKRS